MLKGHATEMSLALFVVKEVLHQNLAYLATAAHTIGYLAEFSRESVWEKPSAYSLWRPRGIQFKRLIFVGVTQSLVSLGFDQLSTSDQLRTNDAPERHGYSTGNCLAPDL